MASISNTKFNLAKRVTDEYGQSEFDMSHAAVMQSKVKYTFLYLGYG